MLHTIGYQYLENVEELKNILVANKIECLVDVRSKPYGRKYAFNQKNLTGYLAAYGIKYLWKGDRLGGFAKILEADIQTLAAWQKNKTACLMCMEADPNKCHRKYEIARRLYKYDVIVNHILT